jgi:Ser/Thr protein kinase RdoA (MazF antagonist)
MGLDSFIPIDVPVDHEEIARSQFGIDGKATPLPGYTDSNARIDSGTGESYLLRVVADPNFVTIDFIHSVMKTATKTSYTTPLPVRVPDGASHRPLGDGSVALLYTWVDGMTFEASGRPPNAAFSIGRTAAEMVLTLDSMDTTYQQPDRHWDLLSASETIRAHANLVSGAHRRALIEQVLLRLRILDLDDLPKQAIHNDLNEGNILISDDQVVGVIDFGDTTHTIRIGELAIACAYAMLDQDDPMSVGRNIVSGYRSLLDTQERESSCLFDLILARLATSLCMGARRMEQRALSHEAADMTWDLLDRLLAADADSMTAEMGTHQSWLSSG